MPLLTDGMIIQLTLRPDSLPCSTIYHRMRYRKMEKDKKRTNTDGLFPFRFACSGWNGYQWILWSDLASSQNELIANSLRNCRPQTGQNTIPGRPCTVLLYQCASASVIRQVAHFFHLILLLKQFTKSNIINSKATTNLLLRLAGKKGKQFEFIGLMPFHNVYNCWF